MAEVCSFTRLTSSAVIGVSGTPVDVAGYSIDGVTGNTAPAFNNGTAANSPCAFRGQTTAAGQSSVASLPVPIRLVNGCFVSFETNTQAVTVFYIQAAGT